MHAGGEPDALGDVVVVDGRARDVTLARQRSGQQHLAALVVDQPELAVGGRTRDAQDGDVVGIGARSRPGTPRGEPARGASCRVPSSQRATCHCTPPAAGTRIGCSGGSGGVQTRCTLPPGAVMTTSKRVASSPGHGGEVRADGPEARVVLGEVAGQRDHALGADGPQGERAGRGVDREPEVPAVEDAGERRARTASRSVGATAPPDGVLGPAESLAGAVPGLVGCLTRHGLEALGELHPAIVARARGVRAR